MPVFQWDSSSSSENNRRYQKMKFRRDRRKGGGNIPIIDDGVKFSPSAEHKVFALCNLIRSNAAYLQRMGQKQFYEKERWVESELPELCEFFSKAQWVIREESLAMGARWAKIRLADIDTLEFFRRVRLRINQAIQGDILQEGTQSWKDWKQAEGDTSKCRSTWTEDYTKKAIRWLATQILKIDAGENDEDEDETQCELYKYYFIRMKRKLATVSLVKQLKEELGRPNLEIIMLGDQEEEESEEKKRARTLEAISRWEEERAVEEEEKQQQRRQKPKKPNSSIMRTLASERVKREEELEAVKVKQQQDHKAALERALQEEEEQKRQTEARKMERRRKKKDERRLRKEDPKKWEQKQKWLQKEKTRKLGYCQFCGEKATIVCRECYNVGLCMASDGCAKTHRQTCSTYYVHEADEVD